MTQENPKPLSEYATKDLEMLMKHKSRQIGTTGTLMILRELLTRNDYKPSQG